MPGAPRPRPQPAPVRSPQLGKGGKVVKITGIENQGRTATVLLRGSNKLALAEADRSLHDALCVVRCLVQVRRRLRRRRDEPALLSGRLHRMHRMAGRAAAAAARERVPPR